MPLFGHKHNNDNVAADAGHNNAAGYDQNSGMTGAGGGGGGNHLHKNPPAHNDPLYPSPNAPGANYDQGMTGGGGGVGHHGQQRLHNDNDPMTRNDEYGGQQNYGAGGAADTTGSGGAAHRPMAPQTDARGNPQQPHTGGGSRFVGKVESAMGTVLGSESLKRKGMEKEQESQALKVQAAELGEAERLEQEALARRQRAVAHGAHPDHKHLGSHNPGAGATNVNELGGGPGVGGMGGAGSAARGGY